MRLCFTSLVLFLLLLSSPSLGQNRLISGRLTSPEDGSPMPGVNITIKGTNEGTVTDADGRYSISAPIGSTLVFSFIGMKTREVLVTDNSISTPKRSSTSPPSTRFTPLSLYGDSSVQEPGVAVLTNQTPSYKENAFDINSIRAIRRRGKRFVVRSDMATTPSAFALHFSSSVGVEYINKLPPLQQQFAQGTTNGTTAAWAGADQQNIFSWGPLVRTLEFDGSNYPYDHHGRLVTSGSGNGQRAQVYDASSFFRTGVTTANELMMAIPVKRASALVFDFENKTRSGIIPNSYYQKRNISLNLKGYQITHRTYADVSVLYNRSSGDLLARGANLSSIVGSVYRTPSTFDNANGLSGATARTSPETHQLPDGTKRSHAPGLADNPYGLANELPDNDRVDRLMSILSLRYLPGGPFSVTVNANVDHQRNVTHFGTPPGYSGALQGRLTDRSDNQTYVSSMITGSFSDNLDDGLVKINLSYQLDYAFRELTRIDGYNFHEGSAFGDVGRADSTMRLGRRLDRIAHEIALDAQYEYERLLLVRLTNRTYFSNTLRPSQVTNLFPTLSVSFRPGESLNMVDADALKLYATISRTLRESPLVYTGWARQSLSLPVQSYASFYESGELTFRSIAPETERKFETGLSYQGYRFNGQLSYFNNKTHDLIAPVSTGESFELQNVAAIRNYGTLISFGLQNRDHQVRWGFDLKWSKYNSVVDEIYATQDYAALAGFESARTVLAQGQPVGAIYGTSYRRDSKGQRIIASDGFPIEDDALRMIGNPIPDWTVGFFGFGEYEGFRLSFLVDVKRGGDVWNGTNAMLDYLGRSKTTGDERNTSAYIFEGVNEAGNQNTTAVDFYNTARPLDQNRWVRYGWDGVGENYIEDASWVRLNELMLSYATKWSRSSTVKQWHLSIVAHNLFVITPYTGVDPSSTLFGYSSGNGLDLFNVPATRSYNAQIKIKI